MKMDTNTRFELARAELTVFIMRAAHDACFGRYEHGWEAVSGLACPGSWHQLDELWTTKGAGGNPCPVLADHSDRTIYLFPEANHAFRFWHDMIHIRERLDFALRDELIVAECHQLQAKDEGLSDDACTLLWIDTALQAQHTYFFGSFVDDQVGWAKAQFTRLTSP